SVPVSAAYAGAPTTNTVTAMPSTAVSARMRFRTFAPSAGDDEREDETEQRERLGERDPEEHRRAHGAGRLRLTRHGGDRVTDHQTDADAGADGGAAVDDASTDGGQTLGGVGGRLGEEEEMEQSHVGSPCCFFSESGCWSVRGVHRAVDVDRGEDREDEGLQEADQD